MKKLVLVFGFLGLVLTSSAFAAVDFSVQNVSQDNVDATRVGAAPGDVLRYELNLNGSALGAENIDLGEVLDKAVIVNAGGGEVQGMILDFPDYFCEDCSDQSFSFFVRPGDECDARDRLNVSYEGISLSVKMNCGTVASRELSSTGPANLIFAVVAMMAILGGVMISNRKSC